MIDTDMELTEAQQNMIVKTYADLVNEGVPEPTACHGFIACGLSLLAACCCPDHLVAQYRIVEDALAKAKSEITPRAN